MSGKNTAAAVQRAVEEYIAWQSAKLGRDINPSYLTRLLMETGVKRVDLKSPAFLSLRDGAEKVVRELPSDEELPDMVPQLAKAGRITITNGGSEDE